MMGDMAVIWYLSLSFNGLLLGSVEPFNSEEACYLAGRAAHLYQFECIDVAAPPGMVFESS